MQGTHSNYILVERGASIIHNPSLLKRSLLLSGMSILFCLVLAKMTSPTMAYMSSTNTIYTKFQVSEDSAPVTSEEEEEDQEDSNEEVEQAVDNADNEEDQEENGGEKE